MDLAELLALQDGVVTRRRLLDDDVSPNDIRRMLRSRELVRVQAGIYIGHTGPLTLAQRQWVAVLACWPAALTHQSVIEPDSDGPVHVAIAHHRSVVPPSGVVLHRMAQLDDRVRWNTSPPKVRVEHALLDMAAQQADVAATFRVLADGVQSRRTTADKLREALQSRSRSRDRRLLGELLDDLATGACSVLERGYLELERRHGLPTSSPSVSRQREVQDHATRRYQDVRYEDEGVAVELDGRAFHDNAAARDRDAHRDLDHVVVSDGVTVRLTFGQVFRDGCATIAKVGLLLQGRGWAGEPARCPNCP